MSLEKPRGANVVRANLMGDLVLYILRFESNNTSAPDGAVPSGSVTLARSGTGDYTITFDEGVKPAQIHAGFCYVEEDDATLRANYTGYTASTGVALVSVYSDPDTGTGGQPAPADSTDKTVVCMFVCNRKSL